MAERTALAFHAPPKLEGERARFRHRAGLVAPVDEAFASARRVITRLREAKRGS